ncbi:hypothetical protein RF11_02372 [Thelohanellus kitauei]|uniref:Uncharacterized protein n=1 Tax=Thelohanellus kitauei TaxID=669202 RepID=A0A0C2M043_THEKT|nr:hypothetical protein RF11_02372 [Thelohanellus kitauei]
MKELEEFASKFSASYNEAMSRIKSSCKESESVKKFIESVESESYSSDDFEIEVDEGFFNLMSMSRKRKESASEVVEELHASSKEATKDKYSTEQSKKFSNMKRKYKPIYWPELALNLKL